MGFGAYGTTLVISTTGTSKSLAIPIAPKMQLVNTSTTLTVHVDTGIGAATAVIPTADGAGARVTSLAPLESRVVDIPQGHNFVACIASGAGPTLVSITVGAGS